MIDMKKIQANFLEQNALEEVIDEDVIIQSHGFHEEPKRTSLKTRVCCAQFSPNHGTDYLRDTVNKIMTTGKSILNFDESIKLGAHLLRYGLHNNEENRRRFRNVLFTPRSPSDDSIAPYISLVVLGHEAVFQKSTDGELFRDILKNQDILIAIQLDKGTAPLYSSSSNRELIIQGLDDLDKRCMAYRKSGCDAAKFTAVFKVDDDKPSLRAIHNNVYALARFASVCQAHCLVPIVGCELSMSGDNDVDCTQRAMELILVELMVALTEQEVLLEATILAPNMCTPGNKCSSVVSHTIMACASVSTIRRTVPPAVGGIAFLTTAQELEEGCVNLDAISNVKVCKPWPITSIFGEALMDSIISLWAGYDSAIEKARNELMKWCMINSLAAKGVFINVKEEPHIETEEETLV